MSEIDPLKDYNQNNRVKSYEVADLLDERVDEDKRTFFDSVKDSFGLPDFATGEDGLFEEKRRILRVGWKDQTTPLEYLDELWIKDLQIVATAMRNTTRDGVHRVTFATTGILPENLHAIYEIYNVDRAIFDLPPLPLPPEQPNKYL